MRSGLLVLILAVALSAGCKGDQFKEDQTLGGELISKDVLNDGMGTYRKYCSTCHGNDGTGRSIARHDQKNPRDLTRGLYKFTSVEGDGLPLDEDLVRLIRRGIRGTQMPPLKDLSKDKADALAHYLKTFGNRWRSEKAGKKVPTHPDPWSGKRAAAVDRGRAVYHSVAQCWQCHPAYVGKARITAFSQSADREAGAKVRKSVPFRTEMASSARIETDYGPITPPDFLSDVLPTAWGDEGIYRAIAAGIGGTPMPTWANKLSPPDLWAVVYYVRDLVRHRGTPAAARIRGEASVD